MGAGRAERSGVDVGARERGATTRRKHRRTSAAPRRRKRYTANAESPAKAQNTLARAREEALMGAEEVCVHTFCVMHFCILTTAHRGTR
jgi:hypothetical protein